MDSLLTAIVTLLVVGICCIAAFFVYRFYQKKNEKNEIDMSPYEKWLAYQDDVRNREDKATADSFDPEKDGVGLRESAEYYDTQRMSFHLGGQSTDSPLHMDDKSNSGWRTRSLSGRSFGNALSLSDVYGRGSEGDQQNVPINDSNSTQNPMNQHLDVDSTHHNYVTNPLAATTMMGTTRNPMAPGVDSSHGQETNKYEKNIMNNSDDNTSAPSSTNDAVHGNSARNGSTLASIYGSGMKASMFSPPPPPSKRTSKVEYDDSDNASYSSYGSESRAARASTSNYHHDINDSIIDNSSPRIIDTEGSYRTTTGMNHMMPTGPIAPRRKSSLRRVVPQQANHDGLRRKSSITATITSAMDDRVIDDTRSDLTEEDQI
jgi:hypothetical protein